VVLRVDAVAADVAAVLCDDALCGEHGNPSFLSCIFGYSTKVSCLYPVDLVNF